MKKTNLVTLFVSILSMFAGTQSFADYSRICEQQPSKIIEIAFGYLRDRPCLEHRAHCDSMNLWSTEFQNFMLQSNALGDAADILDRSKGSFKEQRDFLSVVQNYCAAHKSDDSTGYGLPIAAPNY